jgi:hypothetical protein
VVIVRRGEREIKVGDWVVGHDSNGKHFGGFVISTSRIHDDITTRVTGGEIPWTFITTRTSSVFNANDILLDLDEIKALMDIALDKKDYRWCRRLARRKKIFMYFEGIPNEV